MAGPFSNPRDNCLEPCSPHSCWQTTFPPAAEMGHGYVSWCCPASEAAGHFPPGAKTFLSKAIVIIPSPSLSTPARNIKPHLYFVNLVLKGQQARC
jgi:hypothetical protein